MRRRREAPPGDGGRQRGRSRRPSRRPRRRRRWKPILRPRAGRRLPEELRSPQVGELARDLPGGLLGPELETLIRRIDQGPVHHGNAIHVFTEGEAAFRAMREAIASAEREVLVESYIWRDDATGRAFLRDLGAAAARGVTVRVVADALGSSGTRREFWRDMARHGIEARLFHPLFPRLWSQLYRDHRKILVVDRRVAFTGGMNIGEEYGSFKPRQPGAAWRDTHLRARGPVAWEMAVVFEESWLRSDGEPFAIESMDPASQQQEGARVLVLDARPGRGHEEAASVLAAIVGGARRRLWVTNAYFAPRPPAVEILGRAVDRGVDVRLLLPGKTDVPLVRHAGHGFFQALLDRGVRIFEYRAAILHAKSLVADGEASVVGSTNLDFRSFHFNAECNLVMFDRGVGARLEQVFEADLGQAEEIDAAAWRRRGVGHRIGDRLARMLSPLL